jgi:hypothetical protein
MRVEGLDVDIKNRVTGHLLAVLCGSDRGHQALFHHVVPDE